MESVEHLKGPHGFGMFIMYYIKAVRISSLIPLHYSSEVEGASHGYIFLIGVVTYGVYANSRHTTDLILARSSGWSTVSPHSPERLHRNEDSVPFDASGSGLKKLYPDEEKSWGCECTF